MADSVTCCLALKVGALRLHVLKWLQKIDCFKMLGMTSAVFGIKKGIDKNIGVDENLIFHVAHPG